MSFVEAVAYLTGASTPTIPTSHRSTPAIKPRVATSAEPSGMTAADALALVEAAQQRLWTPAGFGPATLDYLHRRGLSDEAIRGARLGYAEALPLSGRPRGVVIPWFDNGRLALVKLRQPDGMKPKYREVFRDRPTLYPGRHVIRPGRPLVIVEGEFDAILVRQALGELAPVVTLGSASSRPVPGILGTMLAAAPWYIATDGDEAGDKAADGWPSSARRVRPAAKDWTAAHLAGVNLRDWWEEVLVREAFLAGLQARGVRLDGRLVHPRIAIGTVTGRVVYTVPALQTMPEADRLARLAPVVEGRVFIRADYGQIEPRIMHALLHRRGLITWNAGEDLYRDLADGVDRDTAKVIVNKLINGARPDLEATGRFVEFTEAVEQYRAELAADARTRGCVETLAGRMVPLSPTEDNHAGKAVNRVVQGTAADIFNRAVLGVAAALERGVLGDVAFLLYDELWVECDPVHTATVAELVRTEMITAALELGVSIPVRLDPDQDGPPRFLWDQLSRWRWGAGLEDPASGIVSDRPDRDLMLETLVDLCWLDDAYAREERVAIQAESDAP
jgi:hypothetical protein